jgi:hypothetical protein
MATETVFERPALRTPPCLRQKEVDRAEEIHDDLDASATKASIKILKGMIARNVEVEELIFAEAKRQGILSGKGLSTLVKTDLLKIQGATHRCLVELGKLTGKTSGGVVEASSALDDLFDD